MTDFRLWWIPLSMVLFIAAFYLGTVLGSLYWPLESSLINF